MLIYKLFFLTIILIKKISSICRNLTGSAFSIQALFLSENVLVDIDSEQNGEEINNSIGLKTSKMVERFRCRDCGSPVFARLGNKIIAVPLSVFDPAVLRLEKWQVTTHLHYSNRIIDINDDTPKHLNGNRSPLFVNK